MIGTSYYDGESCETAVKNCSLSNPDKQNITVSVEGNIGSGKTTLLTFFRKNPLVEVIEEPVKKWQNVDNGNLLDMFYSDTKRWSYVFESYALLTMMEIHCRPHRLPVKLIERSVFSANFCFEDNLYKSGLMMPIEDSIHQEWFDWITAMEPPKLDLIVYLRTSPERCMERIKKRQRSEESSLPMELIQALHEKHEDWLIHQKRTVPAPVIVVDGNQGLQELFDFYNTNSDKLLGLNDCFNSQNREKGKQSIIFA